MNNLRRITGAVLYALILAGAGALAPAGAQVDTGNPDVIVDLSVIEDAGYGAAPVYAPAAPVYLPASPIGRRLLMPGPENPVSQLHLPPVRGKMATSSREATVAARPVMPTRAALTPPPAKAPKKPPVTISAVPAPVIAPSPAPDKTVEPAPAAKPTAAPSVAMTAPPARPAPVEKAKPAPAVKPTAAPSAALTPPPPPMMAKTAAKTKKTPAAPPEGKPKAPEKAALPPAGTPLAPGRAMRIVFESTAATLPDTAKASLATLAAQLKGQHALRLKLNAYAGGESLSSGKARRLSLSRALSVRSYLIENGVRSTRIDVRALGNKTAEEPLNRVDVIVAER